MSEKIKNIPLGDRVLVRPGLPDEAKKTKSGIIIPETVNKERPEQGKIIAVGEGKTTDEGKLIPMKVKVGDRILFSKYGPDEIKIEEVEYYILREEAILAVVKQ
jgi:chaperonin GroES